MTDQEPKQFNPKFRRRKRHQGSTWTPENSPALLPDGAWCRWCKTRHGYMTMGIAYEKRKRCWVILWSCRKTGFVIEEMELHGHKNVKQGDLDDGTSKDNNPD